MSSEGFCSRPFGVPVNVSSKRYYEVKIDDRRNCKRSEKGFTRATSRGETERCEGKGFTASGIGACA